MPSRSRMSFKATVSAGEANKGLLFMQQTLDTRLGAEIRNLSDDAVSIFRFHAPVDTGQLRDNIAVKFDQGRRVGGQFASGLNFAVTTFAKAKTGFDYVAATRFGHNVSRIYPKGEGKLFLQFSSGRRLRVWSVVPREVTTDWAEAAQRAMDYEADRAAKRVARRI